MRFAPLRSPYCVSLCLPLTAWTDSFLTQCIVRETNRTKPSIRPTHTRSLEESGKLLWSRLHAVVSCASACRSPGRILPGCCDFELCEIDCRVRGYASPRHAQTVEQSGVGSPNAVTKTIIRFTGDCQRIGSCRGYRICNVKI